jgi:hypothetical protein
LSYSPCPAKYFWCSIYEMFRIFMYAQILLAYSGDKSI